MPNRNAAAMMYEASEYVFLGSGSFSMLVVPVFNNSCYDKKVCDDVY